MKYYFKKQITHFWLICALSSLSLFVKLHAQKADVVPQIRHADSITHLCTDKTSEYLFSSDVRGNVKMWYIKTRKLLRNLHFDLSSIDKLYAFSYVNTNHLFAYSKADQKIVVLDYKKDSIITTFPWDEELFDIVTNYNKFGVISKKSARKFLFIGNTKRAYYDSDTFELVHTISGNIPHKSTDLFQVTEFGEEIYVAERKHILRYNLSNYGDSKPFKIRLTGNDTKIENIKLYAPRFGKEHIMVAGDSTYYTINLNTYKQQRIPRLVNRKKYASSNLKLNDKQNWYNISSQLAFFKQINKVVFGLQVHNYPDITRHIQRFWEVPQLNHIETAYSNYGVQDIMVGIDESNQILAHRMDENYVDGISEKEIFGTDLIKPDEIHFNEEKNELIAQSKSIRTWDLNKAQLTSCFNFKLIPEQIQLDNSANRYVVKVQNMYNRTKDNQSTYDAFVFNKSKNSPIDEEIMLGIKDIQNVHLTSDGMHVLYTQKNLLSPKTTNIHFMDVKNTFNYLDTTKDTILNITSNSSLQNAVVHTNLGFYNYDFQKFSKPNFLNVEDIQSFDFYNNRFLYTSGNVIYEWDLKRISKEYLTVPEGIQQINDLKNGRLGVFTPKGNVLVYNANKELIIKLKAYTSIIDVVYDAKRKRYLKLLADGVIMISSKTKNTCLIYSNSDTSPSGNYLFFTDENDYTGNKGLYDLIQIRKNEKLFSSSHYDLEFNNPISIINNLQSDDKEYLDVLKLVQQKRNKKYGFIRQNTKKLSPEIFDLNDSIVSVTEQDTLNYLLQINGRDTKIKKLEGYLNGVPILNMNYNQIKAYNNKFPTTKSVGITTEKSGIFDLALQLRRPKDSTVLKNTLKRFRLEVPVGLVTGTNTIEFFVTDTDGVKSNVLTYKVSKKGDINEKYDLYAFAISVDNYKDDDYKLRYAKKDGRDLLKFLYKNHISENYVTTDTVPSEDDELDYVINDYTYRKIYTDSLFDKEVKKENLHKVAQFFSRAKPNDRVILFISGHGVLDKNQDFYFATQDLDFSTPEQRGISFKEIENILKQSNSKHKLLLIDACHSGEVDKNSEEEEEQTESLPTDVIVSARGAIGKLQKNKVGLQNSFELMKELFADVSRGTGIQVISAAAGNSYALESDRWQNGIFTYCLLKGLSYNKEFDDEYDNLLKNSKSAKAHFKIITMDTFDYPYADYNQDDKVSVAELKEFVSKEVERMTNGKQKPTSRQGNIEFDFVMW